MIPAANRLQGEGFTSLKLEVRRTVNSSTYMGFAQTTRPRRTQAA